VSRIPKTAEGWTRLGYLFHERGTCDACSAAVEFWWAPGRRLKKLVPLDAVTLEPHFASCPNAQDLREIMQEVG
jgi:hypothetical protein